MPDDEMEKRVRELKKQVDDLEAVIGAAEDLRRDAEREEPYGLARLRGVKRKEDYPDTEGEDR